MAVYTPLEHQSINQLVRDFYPEAEVLRAEGIASGIENTNYFVEIAWAGRREWFVLTLLEMNAGQALAEVLGYQRHLSRQGLTVPFPACPAQGSASGLPRYEGKPVILVPRVPGRAIEQPDAEACYQAGQTLARLHQGSEGYSGSRELVRNSAWLKQAAEAVMPELMAPAASLLQAELEKQTACSGRWLSLPRGWGHLDFFRDNVLFDAGRVSGIIDFFHACEDAWVVDLAIALNDWTWQPHLQACCAERLAAFLSGYQSVRVLSAGERASLQDALALGGLRFWLSRLNTLHVEGYQQAAQTGNALKDPAEFEARLRWIRSDGTPELLATCVLA